MLHCCAIWLLRKLIAAVELSIPSCLRFIQRTVCHFKDDFELDSSYPVRKIKIGCTVNSVLYLLQSNTYVVVKSEKKNNAKLCVLINEDKSFEEHERPESFVFPKLDIYTVSVSLS